MKCFEYLLKGKDIVAVLPTGFGKSLLFQLLPDIVPVKADNNRDLKHRRRMSRRRRVKLLQDWVEDVVHSVRVGTLSTDDEWVDDDE